ncbi:hypothetical protein [Bacillus atrophaeus]|uniref:hypothetical protein n=1 Tax=Bacillus atrophaeus TaxID=1452 RepID=UPI002E1DCDE6|nr:hypothetical protein [Bacillus atrophaeus]
MSRTKNAMENRALKSKLTGSFLHKATLTIEFGYIIFCFSLLFTRAWYVSLMLIVLVFLKGTINKLGVSKKFVWIADCILSISLLTIVVMIYI